ncbi:pilin [Patescibacteria group bacterium]|nr:pilin [Patescibacteria group bacterium]MBU1921906.1 pilin [Patescibacteria group bacterium]
MHKNKTKKLILIFSVLLLFSFFLPTLAGAITPNETGLGQTADEAGLPKTDIASVIGSIIKTLLAVLGVIFFILLVYGGLLWMTARGNQEKVDKAKDALTNAIIGLLIILVAYAFATYIIAALTGSGTPPPTP